LRGSFSLLYFTLIKRVFTLFVKIIVSNGSKYIKGITDEKKLIKLRAEVNFLYFYHHMTKSAIAHKKKVARNFVIKWTQSPDQDFSEDHRGWPKHLRRKWDPITEQRIEEIHEYLTNDPHEFYTGATAIAQEWLSRYPEKEIPPLRTLGQILKELGLSKPRKKGRNKGAARYLCYPEYSIYHTLGGRLLEADFIGKKYIRGKSEPINFIGFSFKKDPKLRYFKQIEAQTANTFIKQCEHFFTTFEKPAMIKVDNALATIGSASGKRNVSRAMKFLLESKVIPIFAVPRKPFSQASIEGNNSVFARNFWNKREFTNAHDIDEKLEWFNRASLKYTRYTPPKQNKTVDFMPRIYFIRQVKHDKELNINIAFIDVLNEKIALPNNYINYFVLAEWNLLEEQLYIHFEKEQKLKTIKKIKFSINKRSKTKLHL